MPHSLGLVSFGVEPAPPGGGWTDPGHPPLAVVDGSSLAHRVETCPVGNLNEKNNILDCSAKSKKVRCGHNRLILSTLRIAKRVERADAGIYPDHAPGILTFFNATPISLVPLYRTRVKIALF